MAAEVKGWSGHYEFWLKVRIAWWIPRAKMTVSFANDVELEVIPRTAVTGAHMLDRDGVLHELRLELDDGRPADGGVVSVAVRSASLATRIGVGAAADDHALIARAGLLVSCEAGMHASFPPTPPDWTMSPPHHQLPQPMRLPSPSPLTSAESSKPPTPLPVRPPAFPPQPLPPSRASPQATSPALRPLDAINERFRRFHPSDDLEHAGVLVHVFDGQHEQGRPWLPCPTDDQTNWCRKWGDRFAASLIHEGNSVLYNPGETGDVKGLIFRPSSTRLLCSYAIDGGSMTQTCEPPGVSASCIPGCWSGKPGWCEQEEPNAGFRCGGPFAPDRLATMLRLHEMPDARVHYNEVIVDAASYVERLPHSLEAVIGDREVHMAFLREYHLSAHEVPLIKFGERGFEVLDPATGS